MHAPAVVGLGTSKGACSRKDGRLESWTNLEMRDEIEHVNSKSKEDEARDETEATVFNIGCAAIVPYGR